MNQILGVGAYGTVEKRGNYAVKTISHTCFLAQEYAAFMKLRNSKQILQASHTNWTKKEIYMDLYQMSLRKWFNKHRDNSKNHIIAIKIIKGLAQIHNKGLIHGDLKPGNILINLEPFKVVIGDLGLVSPHKYSRCHYTALPYRDPVIMENSTHDIFSLGIIFLELFGNIYIPEAPKYDVLIDLVKNKVPEPYVDLIISMIQPKHENRPNIHEIYNCFTGKNLKFSTVESFSGYRPPKTEYIIHYKQAPRPYKAYTGACLFLQNHPEYDKELVHSASSYMAQLLFSKKPEFNNKYKIEEILDMGFKLLEDVLYINCIISRSQ